MASDGSRGPKPYTQHRASTVFLRVPVADWPAVKRGLKREFRVGNGSATFNLEAPTPVVAYRVRRGEYEATLMVLERTWQEPLGAISEESLRLEGFGSMAEFRRYWMSRERKRFRPTRMVFVYRVRPWTPEDYNPLAAALLERLYGAFIPHAS